jgi:hypothetical protein
LAALVVLAALPVVGHWVRGEHQDRCALDGVRIVPAFRVRIVHRCGQTDQFCCIRCVELWLQRQVVQPDAVYVTDEVTGQEIDSALAWFVRSSVITTATTGNRIHAFQTKSDAERHAVNCRGTVLRESDRPFQAIR